MIISIGVAYAIKERSITISALTITLAWSLALYLIFY
jgi:hypothetical protein